MMGTLLRHLFELVLLSAALFVASTLVFMTYLIVPQWRRSARWLRYWHMLFSLGCAGTVGLLLCYWWSLAQ